MENTWASGAVELLRHADSHINLESAFDRRIAFISIDSAVETMMGTFLSLPKSKSGITVSRKQVEEAEKSFPLLLEMFWSNVSSRLPGIDHIDIEHYHRIRNTLYHHGTGLSVDEQYLLAYRQIAALILEELFDVKPSPPRPAATLEHLIVLWNRLEQFRASRVKDVMTEEDTQLMRELRAIRNEQVHSLKIDSAKVQYAVGLAERLLQKMGQPI